MFDSSHVLLVPLLEIEHPLATIRLCDGGFIDWPGRGTFINNHPTYGKLGGVEAVSEGIGDEAPAGRFTLQPPSATAAVNFAQPNAQGAPVRMWIAEANPQTNVIMGTPEPVFVGMVDTVSVSLGKNSSEVVIEYVSEAEKLFSIQEGNVLSQSFHQQAWPGELGFSRTTGTVVAVPWGVAGPARGTTYYGGGGGGGWFMPTQLV